MHVRRWRDQGRPWLELRILIRGLLELPPVYVFTPDGKGLVTVQQSRLALALDPPDIDRPAPRGPAALVDFD